MDYELYKDYVIETATKCYPKYVKEQIVKKLKEENIIIDNPDPSTNLESNEDEQLAKALYGKKEAVKQIEYWEFIRPYKYSVLFRHNGLDEERLQLLVKEGNVIPFSQDSLAFDELQELDATSVSQILRKPTLFHEDDKIFLKFSIKYKGFLPGTGTQTKLKYPILVVLHKNLSVLEIRFDRISSYYKESDTFYRDKIKLVSSWITNVLYLHLENINLQPVIDYIEKNKKPEVEVNAKCMSLKMGGKATLESNEDYMLPLLGELKALIKEHENEFQQSPKIKQILEDFIKDTEETSDLPWISLCWTNKIKYKQIIVKFQHNYYGGEYTLLQYIGVQKELGRMDYVSGYLIECKESNQ